MSRLLTHRTLGPPSPDLPPSVYHDSDDAMANAKFFIDHALHDRADFIFILNGESTLKNRIPVNLPNIRVIDRPNTCYDLGAHGEVLLANNSEIANKYDKFILMNGKCSRILRRRCCVWRLTCHPALQPASVRGPFMPRWSRDCWTDAFTSRVTDKVKLVGLTMNCLDGVESLPRPGLQSTAEGMDSLHRLRHLQAMMLATDQVGVRLLLDPLGLDACHSDYDIAVASEVRLTMLVERAGFEVDALMSMFGQGERFAETCMTQDPMEWYPGGYLPLHETLFAKTKRLPSELVDRYSDWARKYSSYEACRQF